MFKAPKLKTKNVFIQNEYRIVITDLPNVFWTSFSGLTETAERGSYFDGVGGRTRRTNGAIYSVEDVTLEIPYSEEDLPLIQSWVSSNRGNIAQVVIRPVRISQESGVTPLNFAHYMNNCRVMSFTPVNEVSRDSSDVALTSLTFSVESFTSK
jgi:hypothetical protein